MQRKQTFQLICAGLCGGLLFALGGLSALYLFPAASPCSESARQSSTKNDEIANLREEILSHFMAEKVEQLTANLTTPQEKTIAIGQWLCGHLRNVSQFVPPSYGQDNMGRFALRMRLCGSRSWMLVRMLDYLGIYARPWNMYNFGGRPGAGHSCVQVFYDDSWHFIDPFYGGYFMKDGKILSWDKIKQIAETGDLRQYMVVWQRSCDRSRGGSQDPTEWTSLGVHDTWMQQAYRPENIRNTRSAGFYQFPDKTPLYATIRGELLEGKGLVIGKIDDEWQDVRKLGVDMGISERLHTLGNIGDYFTLIYVFTGVKPGATYEIRLTPFKTRGVEKGALFAVPTGLRIEEGKAYDGEGEWRIVFTPEMSNCSLLIDHTLTKLNRGMIVDQLVIKRTR